MYHPGGTISEAVDRIAKREWVLPAIQREFVWRPEQICALFDSVMQGYPFGDFLIWKIEKEKSADYRYYGFVLDYHERKNPHCPDLGVLRDTPLNAVLDGQQRLTALNIGLRGSMAIKLPRLWWDNPDAFPRRVLALDLLCDSSEPDEEGSRYRFSFMDQEKCGTLDNGELWYQVSDVLAIEKANAGPEMNGWIGNRGLEGERQSHAFSHLWRLYNAMHVDQTVCWYEERKQDIEHVLRIFERRNAGGTPLSYSDLLLSIATSQWTRLDARKEIYGLVDDLSDIEGSFGLTKDFTLKAGLMLTDLPSVEFRVRNFTRANMEILEKHWPNVREGLIAAVELVSKLGFNGKSIGAESALHLVAYYLHRRGNPTGFSTRGQYADDRETIRNWLIRCVLKGGVWGGGLDTLLVALRDAVKDAEGEDFPIAGIKRAMARRGKGLEFSDEEIEDLADMKFGDGRLFALLALLFPFVDVISHRFHVDHVFPKSRFTKTRLERAGIAGERAEQYVDRAARLANLQLLDGDANNEKRAQMPHEWALAQYPDDQTREHYLDQYLLGKIPEEIDGFGAWYETRRERLKERISELLSK